MRPLSVPHKHLKLTMARPITFMSRKLKKFKSQNVSAYAKVRQRIKIMYYVFLVMACFIFIQQQFKTVAGDNLGAPPWHTMRKPTLWKIISRMPKAVSCAYTAGEALGPKANTTTIQPGPWPSYFKWMSKDLAPWKAKGITLESLKLAKKTAAFRIVIHQGKLYTQLYYRCIQSRMMFTIWGFLNLLDKFPGQVEDVDLYFNCQDRPQIPKRVFESGGIPPPLFGYCSTDEHFDIPFPDFSFWGWPEIKIKPWKDELISIDEGSQKKEWADKDGYAHWKGNPWTSEVRRQLLKCNSSDYQAQIYAQDWVKKVDLEDSSRLSNQCDHKYNIYAEGYAWSASYKYLLACGSPLLAINGKYYEFFTRGLVPFKDFLPIEANDKLCGSIRSAVEWGNSHSSEAQIMGSRGRKFIQEHLNMDRVYEYMFLLLREYAKLQKFNPQVPRGSDLLSRNAVLCVANPTERILLLQSS